VTFVVSRTVSEKRRLIGRKSPIRTHPTLIQRPRSGWPLSNFGMYVISSETRMMGLPYGEEIMIVGRTVWTQCTSVTDGRTDRRTDGRTDRITITKTVQHIASHGNEWYTTYIKSMSYVPGLVQESSAKLTNQRFSYAFTSSPLSFHSVIFCLLPIHVPVSLFLYFTYFLHYRHQWTACVRSWNCEWIQFTGLTLPLRVTPMNNPITLISPVQSLGYIFLLPLTVYA